MPRGKNKENGEIKFALKIRQFIRYCPLVIYDVRCFGYSVACRPAGFFFSWPSTCLFVCVCPFLGHSLDPQRRREQLTMMMIKDNEELGGDAADGQNEDSVSSVE